MLSIFVEIVREERIGSMEFCEQSNVIQFVEF